MAANDGGGGDGRQSEATAANARILLKSFEGFTSFAMSLASTGRCMSSGVRYHKLLYVHICDVCVPRNMKEHYVPKRYCRVRTMPNVMDLMCVCAAVADGCAADGWVARWVANDGEWFILEQTVWMVALVLCAVGGFGRCGNWLAEQCVEELFAWNSRWRRH